jgi:uncharacterized protein involved in exopolysaccharide biosynthesis
VEKSATMDEPSYRAWWALHLRVVRGESLDAEERAAYEAGLAQLHQSESLAAGAASLRQARANVQTVEAEYARLHAQREQLEAEIAALETVLDAETRERLAMKD